MISRRGLILGASCVVAAPFVLRRAFAQSARTLLLADTAFFCDPVNGSDANDGLTSNTAWQHLQYGITYLKRYVDFGDRNVVLNGAAGTYAEGLSIYGEFVGQGEPESFTIRGDVSNPGSRLISSGANLSLNVLHGAKCRIEGFAVESNVGCFSTARSSQLNFGKVQFRAAASFHTHAGPGSSLRAFDSYQIVGSSDRHADVAWGQFQINGQTPSLAQTVVTIDGNLTFGYFVSGIEKALINIAGPRFDYTPGSTVTGSRYNVSGYSHLYVGGPVEPYLPGNAAGYNDGTGLYG